jgi:hypothetical protein
MIHLRLSRCFQYALTSGIKSKFRLGVAAVVGGALVVAGGVMAFGGGSGREVTGLCVGPCMTANGSVAAADRASILSSVLLSMCVAREEDGMCRRRRRAFVAQLAYYGSRCDGSGSCVGLVRHAVFDGMSHREGEDGVCHRRQRRRVFGRQDRQVCVAE